MSHINAEINTISEEDRRDEALCIICETTENTIFCHGGCMNSFHAECLEMDEDFALKIASTWICDDCVKKRHRCFVCKYYAKDADLVKCNQNKCGKYFHLKCLPSLGENPKESVCPRHQCSKLDCESRANQYLSSCIRCTTSFHQSCKPLDVITLESCVFLCVKHIQENDPLPSLYESLAPNELEETITLNIEKEEQPMIGAYTYAKLKGLLPPDPEPDQDNTVVNTRRGLKNQRDKEKEKEKDSDRSSTEDQNDETLTTENSEGSAKQIEGSEEKSQEKSPSFLIPKKRKEPSADRNSSPRGRGGRGWRGRQGRGDWFFGHTQGRAWDSRQGWSESPSSMGRKRGTNHTNGSREIDSGQDPKAKAHFQRMLNTLPIKSPHSSKWIDPSRVHTLPLESLHHSRVMRPEIDCVPLPPPPPPPKQMIMQNESRRNAVKESISNHPFEVQGCYGNNIFEQKRLGPECDQFNFPHLLTPLCNDASGFQVEATKNMHPPTGVIENLIMPQQPILKLPPPPPPRPPPPPPPLPPPPPVVVQPVITYYIPPAKNKTQKPTEFSSQLNNNHFTQHVQNTSDPIQNERQKVLNTSCESFMSPVHVNKTVAEFSTNIQNITSQSMGGMDFLPKKMGNQPLQDGNSFNWNGSQSCVAPNINNHVANNYNIQAVNTQTPGALNRDNFQNQDGINLFPEYTYGISGQGPNQSPSVGSISTAPMQANNLHQQFENAIQQGFENHTESGLLTNSIPAFPQESNHNYSNNGVPEKTSAPDTSQHGSAVDPRQLCSVLEMYGLIQM